MIADVTRGLSEWWAPALAFAAGVVSFASPCVLPLVPGYLTFVAGSETGERKPVVPILLFVLGFSIVFTLVGASTSALRFIRGSLGLRVAGVLVILFGAGLLLYAFRFGRPGLYAERRPFLSRVKPGRAGALPLGMAFAAGWTPCIGPVLGGILLIAGGQGGAVRGGGLLFLYSLGLGVPFLLIGLGVQRLMRALDVVKRNYRWFAGVSGALMLGLGILLVSGLWQTWVTPWLNSLSRISPPL
jgi:cytochrome c-type biogenesis protein